MMGTELSPAPTTAYLTQAISAPTGTFRLTGSTICATSGDVVAIAACAACPGMPAIETGVPGYIVVDGVPAPSMSPYLVTAVWLFALPNQNSEAMPPPATDTCVPVNGNVRDVAA